MADITDGTSNTMLFSERAYGAFTEGAGSAVGSSAIDMWWNSGFWGHSHFDTNVPPNGYKKYANIIAEGGWWIDDESAASFHPGGVNVSFVDGSVKFVRDTISSWAIDPNTGFGVGVGNAGTDGSVYTMGTSQPKVWQALSTRSGGEVISADQF